MNDFVKKNFCLEALSIGRKTAAHLKFPGWVATPNVFPLASFHTKSLTKSSSIHFQISFGGHSVFNNVCELHFFKFKFKEFLNFLYCVFLCSLGRYLGYPEHRAEWKVSNQDIYFFILFGKALSGGWNLGGYPFFSVIRENLVFNPLVPLSNSKTSQACLASLTFLMLKIIDLFFVPFTFFRKQTILKVLVFIQWRVASM